MQPTALALALVLASGAAIAAPPQVATDIPPVHSLVARVMHGVGEPDLILPPGASPHGYAMRPSEAAALADANLIVWTGPALTPWLERAIDALADETPSLELLEVPGTHLLELREGVTFGADEHGPESGRHDAEAGHGADEHDGEGDHGHSGIDPHAWLDPENARLWLGAIAEALATADPGNANAYRANASAAEAELDALVAELSEVVGPVRDRPFFVFHDAYHYFEHRFGIEAAGAISLSDASPPGPARIAAVRDAVARSGAACIFAEPQFPAALIATVTEGSTARSATLDPIGTALEPGPELYPQLMRGLAASLTECLGG